MQDIKIVKVKIKDLRPAEYNPRKASKEEWGQLKTSIENFGLVDPIIVNSNYYVGIQQSKRTLIG